VFPSDYESATNQSANGKMATEYRTQSGFLPFTVRNPVRHKIANPVFDSIEFGSDLPVIVADIRHGSLQRICDFGFWC
jgi:hypothetical protein